ncbi:MAG: response regulator transcription factor [Solirubrobacterales bacterium]|nr:response regulator transcription factor [Solirubrobacterales bacterium]
MAPVSPALPGRPPISVLLAQFEDITGLGLKTLIDGDASLNVVATDVPHSGLVPALTDTQPDVAVLNFGSLASAQELRDLHNQFHDTHLLVLANRPDTTECRQLLSFGATACLAKNTEARDVLHAIHLASRGLQVMPSGILEAAPATGPDLLTMREAEVLGLLQTGRANGEIALELGIGVETVRTHVRRVYRKLGVKTRRELRSGSAHG